jgi:hypothetical protein
VRKIELRSARREDWPEIERLHHEQNAKWGITYEAPRPGPHIAVALVGEDRSGKIVQAVIVERVAEMCLYGFDPKATANSRRDIRGLRYLLEMQGYRWMHCLVPSFLREAIAKPLQRAGFLDRTDELATFTIEVPSGDSL